MNKKETEKIDISDANFENPQLNKDQTPEEFIGDKADWSEDISEYIKNTQKQG